MKIILSPVAGNKDTSVTVNNLTVTIDKVDYDLSVIPVGGQAEASEASPFIGTMTREEVTVKFEYDASKANPIQSPDINDYTFNINNGELISPIEAR